jgi:hypothetical protein
LDILVLTGSVLSAWEVLLQFRILSIVCVQQTHRGPNKVISAFVMLGTLDPLEFVQSVSLIQTQTKIHKYVFVHWKIRSGKNLINVSVNKILLTILIIVLCV